MSLTQLERRRGFKHYTFFCSITKYKISKSNVSNIVILYLIRLIKYIFKTYINIRKKTLS